MLLNVNKSLCDQKPNLMRDRRQPNLDVLALIRISLTQRRLFTCCMTSYCTWSY
jgi:hypothetical protein